MPMPIAAKVGVIAVSVAVAAAIAIYESPELQRAANDLRRRIAIALHAVGDRITPEERENLFNRPEDAEGFLRSRRQGSHNDPGVEADDETLRRQREEIMYWNAIRESKEKMNEMEKQHRSRVPTNFDEILETVKQGPISRQTGHEASNQDGLTRRRNPDGLRGLNQSVYTSTYVDEHAIEDEKMLMDPGKDEVSDIYSATEIGDDQTIPNAPQPGVQAQPFGSKATSSTSERELGDDEYMTAGQLDRDEAYSSIEAWAQGASNSTSIYSPPTISLPSASEADFLSDGGLTPADSASLAGSGVDVAAEAMSTRDFDILSDDSGMDTPTGSWSDVESTSDESDFGAGHA